MTHKPPARNARYCNYERFKKHYHLSKLTDFKNIYLLTYHIPNRIGFISKRIFSKVNLYLFYFVKSYQIKFKYKTLDLSTNGTNGIIYKCIPGPRTPRVVTLHAAPNFIVKPIDNKATIGSTVELSCRFSSSFFKILEINFCLKISIYFYWCFLYLFFRRNSFQFYINDTSIYFSAVGPPTPYIHWLKNGEVIRWKDPEGGSSKLVIHIESKEDEANYTCHARNSVGISKVIYILLQYKYFISTYHSLLEQFTSMNLFFTVLMISNTTRVKCVTGGVLILYIRYMISIRMNVLFSTRESRLSSIMGNSKLMLDHAYLLK
uniref:Ig-like domain-containing protein n=1 Tax=Heterorhabditis bacteriophora TaxID=37862 RepID=A0A1I7X038_HETBA